MKGGGRPWILATDHTAPQYQQRATPQPKLPLWHVVQADQSIVSAFLIIVKTILNQSL